MNHNFTYVSNQNQELICGICKSYLTNSQILINCGHMFCRDCLNGSRKLWKLQCPVDSCAFTDGEVYDSPKYIADCCDKLRVRCDDCDWEGQKLEVESHNCQPRADQISNDVDKLETEDGISDDDKNIDGSLCKTVVTDDNTDPRSVCQLCDQAFESETKLEDHKCKYQFFLDEINNLRQSNEYLKLKLRHDTESLKNENKRFQNHIYGMSADFTELCKEVLSMKLEIRKLNNGNRVFMQSQQVMQSILQKQFTESDSLALSTNSSSNSKL